MFKDPKAYAHDLKAAFPLGTKNAHMVKKAREIYPLAPQKFWDDVKLELERYDLGHDTPYGVG
jgi:hypothetical protein